MLELFRNVDNREKLEKLVIFGTGGHDFDFSEKLTEIVSKSLLTSFRMFFLFFFLRPIRAEMVFDPPPQ